MNEATSQTVNGKSIKALTRSANQAAVSFRTLPVSRTRIDGERMRRVVMGYRAMKAEATHAAMVNTALAITTVHPEM